MLYVYLSPKKIKEKKKIKNQIQILYNKLYQIQINSYTTFPLHIITPYFVQYIRKMKQIRHKIQNLKNQRRKQFLSSRFKELRHRHFNLRIKDRTQNQSKLLLLLQEAKKSNALFLKISEGNLLNQLNFYTEKAIQKNNKQEAKLLLIVFSYIFKDDINPHQKQQLFEISIKLFESLKLSFVEFNNENSRKQFKQTLQKVSSEIAIYFICNIMFQSQFLEEKDQEIIQKIIYPAFTDVLFFSLKNPQLIDSIQNFCIDVERAIFSIFRTQEDYETWNRQKVKRNQKLFLKIIMNHYLLADSNQSCLKSFEMVQVKLFWLYDKLSDYIDQIEPLYRAKQFWLIVEQRFESQIRKEKSFLIDHIYSIMRTLVDRDIFINQMNQLMLETNKETHRQYIDQIIDFIQYGSAARVFEALQFLEGIIISMQESNNFEKLIQIKGLRLIEMLAKITQDVELKYLSQDLNQRILKKTLTMVYVLIEKGVQKISQKQNEYAICFEKLQGMRKIQQISSWFSNIDQNQNSHILQIEQLIKWILLQGIQLNSQILDII